MAKSNFAMIFVATIACLVLGAITLVVVQASGGTDASDPGYSNTPNATVPGPPGVGGKARELNVGG